MTTKKKSHPVKKVAKPMKPTATVEPEEPQPVTQPEPEPEPEEEEESEDEPPVTDAKASSWHLTYKSSPGKQPATSHTFASKEEAEEFIDARGWGAWAHAVER